MVNVRGTPFAKKPAVNVTVNTGGDPAMAAVPAPPAPPAVKVRVPGATTASPAPLSVMTILPLDGMVCIVTAGVRDTVMVTPVAPLRALLRVIAGWFTPRLASEVSIHINNKRTQTIEDNLFNEWLMTLAPLLFPAFMNLVLFVRSPPIG